MLSCTYTVLDYAQTGLIAAVFFFKVSILLRRLITDRIMINVAEVAFHVGSWIGPFEDTEDLIILLYS